MSFWDHIVHGVEHTVHTAEHTATSAANTVAHGATHLGHIIANGARSLGNDALGPIEKVLKSDLMSDAKSLADPMLHTMQGEAFLKLIHEASSEPEKLWSDLKNDAKNFWVDPLKFSLETSNSITDIKAPVITITPHFSVEKLGFAEKLIAQAKNPSYDFNELSFSDYQQLNIDLAADIEFKLGLDVNIETYDQGKFQIPTYVSKRLGQTSVGDVSISAKLDILGNLEVGAKAENKNYSFSTEYSITASPSEDIFLSVSESVDAGSLVNAAKHFLEDPLGASSAERSLIEKGNHFGLAAHVTENEPHQWLDISKMNIDHDDDLTGLDGSFTIKPLVVAQVGIVLDELNEGVNLASLNMTLAETSTFKFGDSSDIYDFSFSAGAGLTGLRVQYEDFAWKAFHQNLATETFNLADYNLITGATNSGVLHPEFSSSLV